MPKIKILIVEDELLVADNLADALKTIGYDVCEIADNGADAFQLFQNENPDLVLMDISLKGGINGISAAIMMKGMRDVPLIFLTALGDAGTVNSAKEAHPAAYIVKPFHTRDIAIAIEIALNNFSNAIPATIPIVPGKNAEFDQNTFYVLKEAVFLKTNPGRFVKILFDDILWLEAEGNYTHIVISEKLRYTVSFQISVLQEKLSNPVFFKVHRSFVINMQKVDSFDEGCVYINGHQIQISKTNRAEFFSHLKMV